jgi:hypothetical protein
VAELDSSGNDTGITISDDELTASTPALIAGASTGANEAAPQRTADGLELFFVSDRNGGDTQLFRVAPICP